MRNTTRYGLSASLALLDVLLFCLYVPLNVPRRPLYSFETAPDSLFPFVAVFVVPYISYYPYLLIAAVIHAFTGNTRQLNRYLLATSLSLAIAYVCYGYIQGQMIRPAVPGDDVFSRLVRIVYATDNPYNVFPSLHATLSLVAAASMWKRTRHYAVLSLWGGLIAVSILFVKQHYIADLASAVAVAVVATFFARLAFPDAPSLECDRDKVISSRPTAA